MSGSRLVPLSELLNTERNMTDFTKDGKCSGCGSCCTDRLVMTEDEIRNIKRYVKKNKLKPRDIANYPHATQCHDMTCPFRDETKGCTIYEVRPDICRYFVCNHTEEDMVKYGLFVRGRHCSVVSVRETFF